MFSYPPTQPQGQPERSAGPPSTFSVAKDGVPSREGRQENDGGPESDERTQGSRVEFSARSLEFLARFTRQLLEGTATATPLDPTLWTRLFVVLAATAVSRLKLNPKQTPTNSASAQHAPDTVQKGMGINTKLKLKKIPGGLPTYSHFVDGIVFTKRLVHRAMRDRIANPRILLIAFPLEFTATASARSTTSSGYISLDALANQESEYLGLLVGRILALGPDLVLCGAPVARVALDMLIKGNVAVAGNLKQDVLTAVSRCCGARIVQAFDGLVDTSLGKCGLFSVKTFDDPLIEGFRKTFVFLEDCGSGKVGTIILRGGGLETLQFAKTIMDLVTFVAYNVLLEQSFLLDQRIVMADYFSPLADRMTMNESGIPKQLAELVHRYESLLLSASPVVKFPIPHLLSRLVQLHSSTSPMTPSFKAGANSTAFADLKRQVNQQTIESFENYSTVYYEKAGEFTPFTSQRIMFLFSLINLDSMIPCHPAELHIIEYYSETDISLRAYMHDLCNNASSQCQAKSCAQPMVRHFRSYIHGEGRVNVILEEVDSPPQEGISTWTYCKRCQQKTETVCMSEDSCNYSFGKYLELFFYMEHAESSCLDGCSHDVHREHVRFFSLNRFVVRLEFEPIALLEVSVPAMKVQSSLDVAQRLKAQDYEARRTQVVRFYDSVVARIKHFAAEATPQENMAALFMDFANGLSKRAVSEKKSMLQLLQQSFAQSSDMDTLALNTVLQTMYDNVNKWESDFSVLAKSFFTLDTSKEKGGGGMRFQIRGLFSDASGSTIPLSTEDLKDRSTGAEPVSGVLLGSSPTLSFQLLEPIPEESPEPDDKSKMHLSSNRLGEVEWFDFKNLVTEFDFDSDANANITDVFAPSSIDLLSNETDDILDIPISPTFSMAARWRLEFIDEEEDANDEIGSVSASRSDINKDLVLPPPILRNSRINMHSGERASILQMLSKMWSGSLKTLPPLEYPLVSSEHLFQDCLVIVREEELSSIIAFTLSSSKYKKKLKNIHQPSTSVEMTQATEEFAPQGLTLDALEQKPGEIEEKLTSGKGIHIKFEFLDGPTKLECRVYFAEQFDALRKNCGFEDGFLQSLARCNHWDALGGKSGSAFMKTRDDRLILKQLSKIEMEALIKFAPFYFTYMSEAFFHQLPTVLAKIFGFYRIGIKNSATGKKDFKMDVLVMENLFYERTVSRIFDLKGSMRNRHVQSTGKQSQVLLDENLLEFLSESPLFIREYSKRMLRASVWNDTLFLSKMDVMDYSLLVGIDDERKELVVGIVDYMRTFTWDKKLESWVKETGLLGGGTVQPTILSPRQYKNRFRESMENYFLTVTSFFEKVD
ncbi:hypothetical protein BC830DRAFT_1104814 [Chytriomyces sp. MP71]|nr:hypothetical protein BC830DRAFT_1104814 [Chytriomyces sp. MP71]